MKLTRLRQRPNCSPLVEVERDFLFASMMLVHIERLPGISVTAKCSSALSDSFEAFFAYKHHAFYMGIPFGTMIISAQSTTTPLELLEELAVHIDGYRTVWPQQLLWALARYFFLPHRPPNRPDTRHLA